MWALHYGARSAGGVLDGWLVDTVDEPDVARVQESGLACAAVPLLMTSPEATAAMAVAALDAGHVITIWAPRRRRRRYDAATTWPASCCRWSS